MFYMKFKFDHLKLQKPFFRMLWFFTFFMDKILYDDNKFLNLFFHDCLVA